MNEIVRAIYTNLRPLIAKWVAICMFFLFIFTTLLSDALPKALDPNNSFEASSYSKIEFAKPSKSSSKIAHHNATLSKAEIKKKAKVPKRTGVNKPVVASADTSGNAYDYGFCTWYVKSRRPDIPNNLGDADAWVYNAQAHGIPTGVEPKEGAIGQQGMHVVYVEKINPDDGTVFISEMNFAGWGVISHRNVPASSFTYIY